MPWSLIVNALTAVLMRSGVPKWVLGLFKDWLSGLEVSVPVLTAAAPDGLKSWLKGFLLEQVGKLDRPFLRLVLTQVVTNLTDTLLDQVWDRLFPGSLTIAADVVPFGVDFDALADQHLMA